MQQTPDEIPVGFTAFIDSLWISRRCFSMCFWTHEKKTFFSYLRLTRSGSVGQGRAILRAAQRAKRLDGRWSGGYFATGAEGQPYPARRP
jgi:hypothetical protein